MRQSECIRGTGVRYLTKTTLSGGGTTSAFYYLHRDHLGSVDVITSGSGSVLDRLAFDPFGGRRQADWSRDITQTELDQILDNGDKRTYRGFTDHEHLDRTGIVHMNGRIYDPVIGRFLNADPIVQAPLYSQSYNRYAYAFNSPLSFVDPSGYSSHDDVNPTEAQFEEFWRKQRDFWGNLATTLEWAIRLTNFSAERYGNWVASQEGHRMSVLAAKNRASDPSQIGQWEMLAGAQEGAAYQLPQIIKPSGHVFESPIDAGLDGARAIQLDIRSRGSNEMLVVVRPTNRIIDFIFMRTPGYYRTDPVPGGENHVLFSPPSDTVLFVHDHERGIGPSRQDIDTARSLNIRGMIIHTPTGTVTLFDRYPHLIELVPGR